MWSAVLIREARLRAGLTQQDLADRSGRKRSVIARWEQGAIEPSLETFLEIIGICGFELPPELVPRDESSNERLQKNALLSPERRVHRALKASSSDPPFDPYAILAALERRHTAYVVIGAFARIVQGAEETADGVDIAPSLRGGNLQRLTLALRDLGAARADGQAVALDDENLNEALSTECRTATGKLTVVPEPAGTRGGLRRPAARRRPRVDRQGPSHLSRLDRRPRPHARRPRTRARHAEAHRPPTPPSTRAHARSRAYVLTQPRLEHAQSSCASYLGSQQRHRCTLSSANSESRISTTKSVATRLGRWVSIEMMHLCLVCYSARCNRPCLAPSPPNSSNARHSSDQGARRAVGICPPCENGNARAGDT